MRNRWITAGLLAAGLLLNGTARGQGPGWDLTGNEPKPLWAPLGPYQHDGSGFYAGVEFMLLSQKRPVGKQDIAYRGVIVTLGSPGANGAPLIEPGQFEGSREIALDTDSFGRTSWGIAQRITVGYRMEDGTNLYVSWLHMFDVKYSAGAGVIGPHLFNPGNFDANTFITAPVYNFSPDFVGRNPFPNPPFTGNPTVGIWDAASDMTLLFTQRFDNWNVGAKLPVFETENARSYAMAGGQLSWLWERFQWRTSKPELIVDQTTQEFGFQTQADSAARYLNTLSQRMYGPYIGAGHEVMLYSGAGGAFGAGVELTGALLLNIVKERAKYIREDESTQAKRAWGQYSFVPNFNVNWNLTWQPTEGITFRAGYNLYNFFNTYYMKEPVSFNVGALDPAYAKKFWRPIQGFNAGVAFVF